MKKENIPKLKAEILKMLPTSQSNIWKTLNIGHRDCSTVVNMLMKENLVGRTMIKGKFIVEKYDPNRHTSHKDIQQKASVKVETKKAHHEDNQVSPQVEVNQKKVQHKDNKKGSSAKVKTRKINVENISELSTRLSKILPALQSDIWKKLGIKPRDCSDLMKTLTDTGFIKRTKTKRGTYMVEKIGVSNVEPVRQKNFSALLSDSGRFSPCTGCVVDCNPKSCNLINNWLLDIKVV